MTTKSSSIQYAYALDSEGILTHVNHARRSYAYTCPGCESPLTTVLGEINAKHFRHFEECCSLETYLHNCAKKAFFYSYQQALNKGMPIKLELERVVFCNGARIALLRNKAIQCQKSAPALYNLTQFFGQVELEKRDTISGMQPDVLLLDESGNRRCYVEICVSNPCSQQKIDTGIPIIEFKIQSSADIQMLLSGSYSFKDGRVKLFNWFPPPQTENICSGICSFGSVEMSIWGLSNSGRLNEQTMLLNKVPLSSNSEVNTWPRSFRNDELVENLRTFLRHTDPHTEFANCILCNKSSLWESGYLYCRSKAKQVPYTEARQCANYEVDG
jgi:hypothetical protein